MRITDIDEVFAQYLIHAEQFRTLAMSETCVLRVACAGRPARLLA